jgi:hypothetical protein
LVPQRFYHWGGEDLDTSRQINTFYI